MTRSFVLTAVCAALVSLAGAPAFAQTAAKPTKTAAKRAANAVAPGAIAAWRGWRIRRSIPAWLAPDPALRAEIAKLYRTIEPEEVYTFAGAEEAIYIAVSLLARPGDHAIVVWPGYQSLP